MPTYSYRCTECGTAFDIQQAFTDDALTVCPNCGGLLRKQYGSVGVTFNGSGFYRTDSRAKPSGDGGAKSEGSGTTSNGATTAPSSPSTSSTSSSSTSTASGSSSN
ncbi:FmdB family zinc ribbon protein [Pseudolysinimonas sp.]|uniref:FmdB family zinc ribbon protein n=1 Tax=Pseudolysinimonas sp. TaxID=2680009 RepID=UPI003F7EE562